MALRTADDDQSLNPGQTHSNEQFNNLEKPNKNNSNIENVKNAEENATEGSWLDNVTKEREELEAQQKYRRKKSRVYIKLGKRGIKRKSPLIGIILTVIGGGIGISALLSPSLLIIHLKENLVAFLDDTGPAFGIRTNKVVYRKFKTAKFSFEKMANGKCGIQCRIGTMPDVMKRNFEAKGFKINATEGEGLAKGRWILNSMEFPDGHIVRNGAEFAEATKDVARGESFKKVFNSRIVYFLNSKFGVMLREKFGLNKLANLTRNLKEKASDKVTTTKEKVKKAIRETLGLPEVDPNANPKLTTEERIAVARENPKFKKVFEFIDGPATKVSSGVTNAVQAICTSYNVINNVKNTTRAAKQAAFVGLAMMVVLNSSDMTKAGDMDTETADVVGGMLTGTDANGMAATDSTGMKMVLYGETGALSAEDQKYSMAPSGILLKTLTTMAVAAAVGGTVVLKTMHGLCKISSNAAFAFIQSCPEQIIAAFATGFATGGFSAVIAAAVCGAKIGATIVAFGWAMGLVINALTDATINDELPVLDGDSRGIAVGDSVVTGTAQIMGGTAATYGMKAGSTADIIKYQTATATIKKQQDEIASYEARDTPFDIYNQYSFLGSIAKTINIDAFHNASILSSINNVLAIIPRSLATITSGVGAAADRKAKIYAEGQCKDSSLSNLGINADAFCNPSYVMSDTELNNDIDSVVKDMISSGNIDPETGDAMPKSNYQKYLDNCANRTVSLGDSSGAIEDDDYEWSMGLKCVEETTELSNFRTYTMDKAVNDTMDEL